MISILPGVDMSRNANHLFAIVRRSPIKENILKTIAKSEVPLSSKDLAFTSGKAQSNIIRILNTLERVELIVEVSEMKSNRMYVITEKGKRILKMMNDAR